MLTAKHCVVEDEDNWWVSPAVPEVLAGGLPSARIVLHPDAVVDAALVQVASAVPVHGDDRTFVRPMFRGAPEEIRSAGSLTCYGYGRPRLGVESDEKLRVAERPADATTTTVFSAPSGALQARGDSGGPCFLDDRVVSVLSTVDDDQSGANGVNVASIAEWVLDTMAGESVASPSPWQPSSTDHVRVEARVALSTAGGQVHEMVPVVLRTAGQSAHGTIGLEADSLQSPYRPVLGMNECLVGTQVDLGLSAQGLRGSITDSIASARCVASDSPQSAVGARVVATFDGLRLPPV